MNEFAPLSKENLVQARWLGPGKSVSGVSARAQGYEVSLPDQGRTILYPLRDGSYGRILPHIYEKRLLEEGGFYEGSLGHVHTLVSQLYELNGNLDLDAPTQQFKNLISTLNTKPYSNRPKDHTSLVRIFESYKDMREKKHEKVAEALTRTIRGADLYVVADDIKDQRDPSRGSLYAMHLSGIVTIRDDSRMNYQPVVADFAGNKGFLPEGFEVVAGVSAPAANK